MHPSQIAESAMIYECNIKLSGHFYSTKINHQKHGIIKTDAWLKDKFKFFTKLCKYVDKVL